VHNLMLLGHPGNVFHFGDEGFLLDTFALERCDVIAVDVCGSVHVLSDDWAVVQAPIAYHACQLSLRGALEALGEDTCFACIAHLAFSVDGLVRLALPS
jgi:hypothetical protein